MVKEDSVAKIKALRELGLTLSKNDIRELLVLVHKQTVAVMELEYEIYLDRCARNLGSSRMGERRHEKHAGVPMEDELVF